MRVGVDAMGGDSAPATEVRGALAAKELLGADDRVVLVGDEPQLLALLGPAENWSSFIEIRHAGQVIGMDESPVEALRTKPDSSMAVLFEMHRAGEVDACISAGNTGACVAAAQMRMRRLENVHRPGITILMPTVHGPVAISDVGANVSCRPQHLHQYGVMSSIYLNVMRGVQNPRVGLLSIGEEDAKGSPLVKQARDLMRRDPNVNFIGNVEGRDLFNGSCDVVVCDGFVGNVVIKLMEGIAEGVLKSILNEVASVMPGKGDVIKLAGHALLAKYDYNEYGGAPLLGVNGICIICHGSSDYRGIKNAVRVALDAQKRHVNERIIDLLAQGQRALND